MKSMDKDLIVRREIEATDTAIFDYHQSDAFEQDLDAAFAAASRRARLRHKINRRTQEFGAVLPEVSTHQVFQATVDASGTVTSVDIVGIMKPLNEDEAEEIESRFVQSSFSEKPSRR